MRRAHDPVPVAGTPEEAPTAQPATAPDRPAWLAPAAREERPKRISPSTLGEHAERGGAGRGRAAAMLRGSAVHLLLERLPGLPAESRPAMARRLLAQGFPELPGGLVGGVIAEALAVLAAPFAGGIFGPDSLAESGIAIGLPDFGPGRIDRLVVGPDRVLVVDFKTDAGPPSTPEAVPENYLLQLACYRSAAKAIWPERLVDAAILWTAAPALMALPGPLMDSALAAHNISSS